MAPSGQPVCDVLKSRACDLVLASYQAMRGDDAPTLFALDYIKSYGPDARSTNDVVQELEHAFGMPVWRHSIRRSDGWPTIPQETELLWTNESGTDSSGFAAS